MRRLALGLLLACAPAFAAPPAAAPAAAPVARLHLGPRALKHVRESHFAGGRRSAGKSLFDKDADLDALLGLAAAARPRRERNGRDKRVADAGRRIGTDGRTGRPVRTVVVISEPDGEVVTMYPGK